MSVVTMDLAAAVEAFAAARSDRLTEKDSELRAVVEAALAARRAGDPTWAAELALAAGVLWAETYDQEGGQAEPGNVDVFVERLTTRLELTADVPITQREAQIERVTYWVAVFTLNDATATAAGENPDLRLRWVTMRDEDVRDTHRPLEGQTIVPGGTFDVDGNALHYPGEPVGPPEIWINCRCMAMPVPGGEMSTLTAATTPGEVTEPAVDPEPVVDEAMPPEWDDEIDIEVPWHGILAVEGIPTGDLRRFASQALTFDEFPLSLTWQRASAERHDGSVVIGRITKAWTDEAGLVRGEGMFRISPEANEVIDMIANGDLRGVSVELDSVAMEYSDVDGNPIDLESVTSDTEIYQHLTAGRVRSATVLPVPAFAESYVALGPWPEGEGQSDAVTASCAPCIAAELDAYAAGLRLFAVSEAAWDGSASRFDDEQWRRATVVDRGESYTTAKERYAVPIREPNGDLSRAGVHAAAGRIDQTDAPSDAIAAGKRKLVAAYRELDEDPPESLVASALGLLDGLQRTAQVLFLADDLQVAGAHAGPDTAQVVQVPLARTATLDSRERTDFGLPDEAVRELQLPASFAAPVAVLVDEPGPDEARTQVWGVLRDRSHGRPCADVLADVAAVRPAAVGASSTPQLVVAQAQSELRVVDVARAALGGAFPTGQSLRLSWDLEGRSGGIAIEPQTTVVAAAQALREHGGVALLHGADDGTLFATASLGVAGETPALVVGVTPPEARVPDRPLASFDLALRHAASFGITSNPSTHDGPGWITNPDNTQRLRDFWTKGEGAAKIRWGQAGDFNRCRRQLAKYVPNPDYLAGTCANLHYVALGVWPGRHTASASREVPEAGVLAASGEAPEPEVAATSPAPNLADPADLPRAEWFKDPGLPMPTPITIVQDKDTGRYRLIGHAAAWGVCHIGLGLSVGQEGCTVAPHSVTNYAHYRVGAIETDDGLVPIGRITMGTGHAGANLSAYPAAEHYDNTGTVVADVAAGEDEHGIWLAGLLRPNVTPEQRAELLAATISGDWRWIGGNLEMVATLAVNTPGFPIPRLAVAASGGRQTALFAAGIVPARVHVGEEDQQPVLVSAAEVARELHRLAKADARAEEARKALSDVRTKFNSERAAKALSVITSGK